MRTINVGPNALEISEIALGCMRIDSLEPVEVDRLLTTALDEGITFYDHADVYGGGKSEEVFSASVKRLGWQRDQYVLQSKVGINAKEGTFDFSKEHILDSTDGILRRLKTDYLDILLLHRTDALAEPDEIAEAFCQLQRLGKVRAFGVSNQNPTLMAMIQRALPMKLLFNQLQLSVAYAPMIASSIHMNNKSDEGVDRDGGVLDYCRLNNVTIQAWSPFQYGFFGGPFLDNPKFPSLNEVILRIAQAYGVTNTAVAVAWISRHPARIQTVVGTTKPQRLKDAVRSQEFKLTRKEWYEIYKAAGYTLP